MRSAQWFTKRQFFRSSRDFMIKLDIIHNGVKRKGHGTYRSVTMGDVGVPHSHDNFLEKWIKRK